MNINILLALPRRRELQKSRINTAKQQRAMIKFENNKSAINIYEGLQKEDDATPFNINLKTRRLIYSREKVQKLHKAFQYKRLGSHHRNQYTSSFNTHGSKVNTTATNFKPSTKMPNSTQRTTLAEARTNSHTFNKPSKNHSNTSYSNFMNNYTDNSSREIVHPNTHFGDFKNLIKLVGRFGLFK